MKKNDHERLREKFWSWWDDADLADIILGIMTCLALVVTTVFFIWLIMAMVRSLRPADELPPDQPAEGVARVVKEEAEAAVWLSPMCGADAYHSIAEYTEGDIPVPVWWNPGEEMAVEWEETCNKLATNLQSDSECYDAHPPVGIDQGGVDWNICTTLWGWDGHGMEIWEMDLFSRIAYLEFWGTSRECVEAGIDSMLLLWDTGEYGRTMGELLSAQYAPGYYVYSPYAYVWDWDYDMQALAEIRAMCESRFVNGPVWCAPYFRLWYYHEWAVPAYEIDGVYFSVAGG